MTDEELAEEWVGENGFGSDCNNLTSFEVNIEMVNAFLAGLKSQTKWHKVSEQIPTEEKYLEIRSSYRIYSMHTPSKEVLEKMTDEELQDIADTYGLYTEEDVKNRLSCELLRIGARNEELEAENAELKAKVERYYNMLEKSMDCESCKYYASVDENLEPCNSCFFDNSNWEIKEND